MLPGKTFKVAISLRNDGDEDETFQLAFQAFGYVVGFKQAIVGVGVKVDGDIFFESGSKFLAQVFDKFAHPTIIFIILMAVGDKDVVFKAGNNR